jgi:hypothetical protein
LTGQWFYPGPPVSSANKTDMTEILLKVVFNTIKQTYKMDIVFISSNPTCSCHDIAVKLEDPDKTTDLSQVGGYLRFPPPIKLTATI